jgi:hypothetical protein
VEEGTNLNKCVVEDETQKRGGAAEERGAKTKQKPQG